MKLNTCMIPLLLSGCLAGCSTHPSNSTSSPDSEPVLAAMHKLPPSQRNDYAQAHSADIQAIRQRGGPEAAELHDLLSQR